MCKLWLYPMKCVSVYPLYQGFSTSSLVTIWVLIILGVCVSYPSEPLDTSGTPGGVMITMSPWGQNGPLLTITGLCESMHDRCM